MNITTEIQVNYKATKSLLEADTWLRELDSKPLIACDFETAIKYTQTDLDSFQSIVDSETSTKLEKRQAQAKLRATALDHPSHSTITHLSVAWSESDSYVFIIDNQKMLNRILYWLVTTEVKQVWHNSSYDFGRIYYYTHKFPKLYEDTALLGKCILNHVETYKAKVGLKELAGKWFGSWSISADNFTMSQMYEEHVLKYAATDACATYKLWESMQSYIKGTYDEPTYPDHVDTEFETEYPEAHI